ncbi:MAG TPA: hypothetical protein VGO52_19195 [Hyphomonadaceae bacterium]|jgi:hypothetical protein|nr:hypothetical protein [Hyphomonadaceae bacterium]
MVGRFISDRMGWRRNFLTYAVLALVIHFALPLALQQLPAPVTSFLAFSALNYVILWLAHAGAAWLLAPPQGRGWWVLRYGAGVVILIPLIWLVSMLLVMALPGLTEFWLHPPDVVLLILFVLLLWLIWLVTAGRQFNS